MRRHLSLAALALLAMSASASAQRSRPSSSLDSPSPEIGVDAAVSFGLSSPSTTEIAIPVSLIRAGFFMSPVLSLEPWLGLNSFSGGGFSGTDYRLGVGLLYHFSASRAANQFYVRPFIGVHGESGDLGNGSTAQFGAGFGVKLPLRDRLATRLEANFGHETGRAGDAGRDAIGLLAGLSFYTR